jgi:hypothetical protein
MDVLIYHGTFTPFDKIILSKGKGYKDFGRGFYTSVDIRQAKGIVERRRRKSAYYRNKSGFVYVYNFELVWFNSLNIKIFNTADMQWFDFVLNNRNCANSTHSYDLVIGPTADDDTSSTLLAY